MSLGQVVLIKPLCRN